MKKQSLLILIIILAGSSASIVYATGTIITDTGITTPSLTVNGNQIGESSFTSYNTIFMNTTTTLHDGTIGNIIVGNDGGVLMVGSNNAQFINPSGTTVFSHSGYGTTVGYNSQISQSATGEYRIIVDSTAPGTVKIYKNSIFLQNLGINQAQFSGSTILTSNTGVSISPSGKYIAVLGEDSSGISDRILVFQGS